MFQYALFLKLCSQGKEVKMDDMTEYEGRDARPIMLWIFDIDYPKASKEELNEITDGFMKLSHRIRRKLFGRRSLEYQEQGCNYDERVLLKEPAYLTGYFQSEKYFKGIESKVRDAFRFSDKIWENIPLEMIHKIRDYQKRIDSVTSVSIHVRRGDYLENSEAYGGICTEDYYKKAIEYIKGRFPDAVFFVFSNDPKWAKDWIDEKYASECNNNCFEIIDGTSEDTGYLDLFLMSRCRHYILANSSFSWWGAWLNASPEKTVVAPSKWFNHQDCKDIYMEEMIKISPEGQIVK